MKVTGAREVGILNDFSPWALKVPVLIAGDAIGSQVQRLKG